MFWYVVSFTPPSRNAKQPVRLDIHLSCEVAGHIGFSSQIVTRRQQVNLSARNAFIYITTPELLAIRYNRY